MRFYAIVYPRSFGNEATIYAFTSKKARDAFREKEDCKNGNYNHRAHNITRKTAKMMLSDNYLDPNTTNWIGGYNVYKGSENDWLDRERRENIETDLGMYDSGEIEGLAGPTRL